MHARYVRVRIFLCALLSVEESILVCSNFPCYIKVKQRAGMPVAVLRGTPYTQAMKIFIVRLIGIAGGLLLTAYVVPGIEVLGWYTAIITALALGILNALIRPLLVVLTLPVTILTLGLFIYVINAALFFFVASFIDGFEVDGWVPAFLGSILVSCISWIVHKVIR